MTRLTYTLDDISGDIKIGGDGSVALTEKDGIDYAPVTVQLPGGERVPFLFTIKNLVAKGNLSSFSGDFNVPSYRGSSFLDPKGRGASTGYDNAVALPARADAEELQKENNKSTKVLKGSAVFNLAKYDPATGEIAGVFESIQPSDTDLGAKTPKDIKARACFALLALLCFAVSVSGDSRAPSFPFRSPACSTPSCPPFEVLFEEEKEALLA